MVKFPGEKGDMVKFPMVKETAMVKFPSPGEKEFMV